MKKFFIVWNKGRSEAFVTDDRDDAKSVVSGKPHRKHGYSSMSTIGEAFHEAYGENGLKIEEIDL